MNRKLALFMFFVLFSLVAGGCAGQPQPAPASVAQSLFPASYDEVAKFCSDWPGEVLGLYEVEDREKYYVRPIDFPFCMTERVSTQKRHWRPCPGVKIEMQATWHDSSQGDQSFTTNPGDRFIDPGKYFEIKLVEVP